MRRLITLRILRVDRARNALAPWHYETLQAGNCKARTSSHSAELRGLQRVDGLCLALRRCALHWYGTTLKRCTRTVILRGNLLEACRA
jgi:hypothetical protein